MRKEISKSVLITGAGGFLGGALIEQMCRQTNYSIMALTSKQEKLVSLYGNRVQCFDWGDFRNQKLPWHKFDTIIHCAFARKNRSDQDIAQSLDYTNELFVNAAKNKVPNIINISSQGVYGQACKPLWKEDTPVAPRNTYSLAKYSTEILLRNAKHLSGGTTNITNLRLASITGGKANLRPELVSILVVKALMAEDIIIMGGKQVVSYIDINDAVDGILALLWSDPARWKQVYNLGSNQQNSIVQIASIVLDTAKDYVDKPIKLIIQPADTELMVGMDSSLFFEDTGWTPRYNIRDTIASLFSYFTRESNIREWKMS